MRLNDKYLEYDRAVYQEVKAELAAKGITHYTVTCQECDGTGKYKKRLIRVFKCKACNGFGSYEMEV